MAWADACLAAAAATRSARNTVKGRRLKGRALALGGRFDEAETELHVAVRVAREVGNPAQVWASLAALGHLYRRRGREEHAEAACREALGVVERVAANLSDEVERRTLLTAPQVTALREPRLAT
jgi:Flp pilus assembly protein TadD